MQTGSRHRDCPDAGRFCWPDKCRSVSVGALLADEDHIGSQGKHGNHNNGEDVDIAGVGSSVFHMTAVCAGAIHIAVTLGGKRLSIGIAGDDTVLDLLDGNGYLLKEFGNVDEIYSSIKNFIELPEEGKQKMAARSEQIVTERASLNNMVDQHIMAIEKALNIEDYN